MRILIALARVLVFVTLLLLGAQHDERLFLTVAQDCAGSVRVPRVSAEVRERSIGNALTPVAQRHTAFLLELAERLPFE